MFPIIFPIIFSRHYFPSFFPVIFPRHFFPLFIFDHILLSAMFQQTSRVGVRHLGPGPLPRHHGRGAGGAVGCGPRPVPAPRRLPRRRGADVQPAGGAPPPQRRALLGISGAERVAKQFHRFEVSW